MTALRVAAPRLPPRPFVRTAWVLHRALHRASGGRVGLTRPEAGKRFGMMRLTTIGVVGLTGSQEKQAAVMLATMIAV